MLLPVVGGAFLATLLLMAIAMRRRIGSCQGNQLSREDGLPMLPSSLDAVEVDVA